MTPELQEFLAQWEHETEGTLALMRALPPDQYDFRPDAGGRSLGELAWHLAEVDAYVSTGIAGGEFKFEVKPPHSNGRELSMRSLRHSVSYTRMQSEGSRG